MTTEPTERVPAPSMMLNGWWVEPVDGAIVLHHPRKGTSLPPGMARWVAQQLLKAADEIEPVAVKGKKP